MRITFFQQKNHIFKCSHQPTTAPVKSLAKWIVNYIPENFFFSSHTFNETITSKKYCRELPFTSPSILKSNFSSWALPIKTSLYKSYKFFLHILLYIQFVVSEIHHHRESIKQVKTNSAMNTHHL